MFRIIKFSVIIYIVCLSPGLSMSKYLSNWLNKHMHRYIKYVMLNGAKQSEAE